MYVICTMSVICIMSVIGIISIVKRSSRSLDTHTLLLMLFVLFSAILSRIKILHTI